jgi:integrase
MLANSFCRDSDPADSSDNGYFRSFRTMHSSHMLREGARPEIVRDNMGHANIDVTQIVYGKSAGCLAKFRCED